MYDSWKTCIWLYIQGKENVEMLINSNENGPFKLKADITIHGVDGVADVKRAQMVADLSPAEKIRYDCDIKATKIILLGLPKIENGAKEVRAMRQRNPDPLALLTNQFNAPPSYNSSRSHYNPPTEYHPYQQYQTAQSYQPLTPSSQQQFIQSPPQLNYDPPIAQHQQPKLPTQIDYGFVVPSFLPTNDRIASLNKAMMFLSTTMNSKFPPTDNQSSSNPRTQANVQYGQVTVQNIQGSQDFLADRLEEMDDDEDLQLHTTSDFKVDHVDAYDSDCDDEATTEYIEHIVSDNDTCDALTCDSNVISYADYMVTIENDAAQYVHPPERNKDAMILSVIKQMKGQVDLCNTVNQEAKSINKSFSSELELYKEKLKILEKEYNSKEFLSKRKAFLDSELRTVIVDRNQKVEDFESQMVVQRHQIENLIQINKSLKNDFEKHKIESSEKNISEIMDLENAKKNLENIVYKFIPKVVEKNDLSKTVTSHLHTNKKIIKKCTKVLAPTLLKIELEPINAYFKNNRVVHQDYLRVTKEHMETLQELLEEARALKPLDEHIGRVSYINASGSQHRSNTKKDRIQRPSSKSKKNKVEAQHRKFKSSSNKNNHVSDCNANLKNVALSKNSENICLSCNECLFSANHDAKIFKTPGLDESSSPEFDLFSDLEENFEEEVAETMAKTMEQYISKTRVDYGSGVTRPKIDEKDNFELKGQFLKELRDNTFSGSDHEDANEHIEKVLEIFDLYDIPNITQDQLMLRAFPIKGKIQRTLDEGPQHYLTEMQDVILFSNGLEVLTRQILDSKGVIPTKPATDAKHNLIILEEKSRRLMKKYMMLKLDVNYVRDPTTPKTVHLNEKEKPLKKLIILNLVYLSNKEGNIEQQLRDSNKGIMQILSWFKKGDLEVYLAQLKQTREIMSTPSQQHLKVILPRYAVSTQWNSKLILEPRQATVPFPSRLYDDCYDERTGSYGLQDLDAYSIETTLRNDSIPKKEIDP
ncbi:hypothetical protein Tco_1485244 [Tanacetum coccineum]